MKKKQWTQSKSTSKLMGLKKELRNIRKNLGQKTSWKKISKLFNTLTIIENRIDSSRGYKK
jgi:hypothetical protein